MYSLQGAVKVLSLVQEVLPPISQLNTILCHQGTPPSPTSLHPPDSTVLLEGGGNTTSQHYTVVESEHPYKPATVANYKVTFLYIQHYELLCDNVTMSCILIPLHIHYHHILIRMIVRQCSNIIPLKVTLLILR